MNSNSFIYLLQDEALGYEQKLKIKQMLKFDNIVFNISRSNISKNISKILFDLHLDFFVYLKKKQYLNFSKLLIGIDDIFPSNASLNFYGVILILIWV